MTTQRSWSGGATYAAATDRTETINTYYTKTEATPGRLKTRSVDGVVTNFAYTPRGELLAQWGATYPVKYEYDLAGRMWKLNTYRTTDPSSSAPASWPAGDVTEWVYYQGTELLQKKKDAAGQGAVYEYDAAGRMSKRTWARPGAVITNYFYNLAGDMRLIDYSDATPDVTITRDLLGRVATIADAAGTRTLNYTPAGLPLSESTAAGRAMQWDYDAAPAGSGKPKPSASARSINGSKRAPLPSGTPLSVQPPPPLGAASAAP